MCHLLGRLVSAPLEALRLPAGSLQIPSDPKSGVPEEALREMLSLFLGLELVLLDPKLPLCGQDPTSTLSTLVFSTAPLRLLVARPSWEG